MITKRTIALVVASGALAAWFAAAATSGVRPSRPAPAPRPQIDLRGDALSAEIERLHDRLRPNVAPEHGRNLFQFAQARPTALARTPVVDAAPVAPPAPVEPAFKLIGIAEDNGARTAILTTANQLLMVHEGDNAGAYRVTGISADAVELKSTGDDSVLRLALK